MPCFPKRNRKVEKDVPDNVTLKTLSRTYSLKLIEKEELSPDTRRFRFALPSPEHILGLPVGQHIHVIAKIGGKEVKRAYTPVSSDEDKGHVDLVIKVYFKGTNPQHPEGGLLSQHLESLSLGDAIEVRGPCGCMDYKGRGEFAIKPNQKGTYSTKRATQVGMIAGGTGIAPMYQFIKHVFRDPEDTTSLSLIFANKTENDILLRKELEELANAHPHRFKIHYTLSSTPPPDWQYSTGYVDEAMIQSHLPPPSDDTLILLCARPAMVNNTCKPLLLKLGYKEERTYKY